MSDIVNSLQGGSDEGYHTGNTGSGMSMPHNLSATQHSIASIDHMESNLKHVQKSRRGFQKHEAAKIQQKLSQLSLGHVAPLSSTMTQTNSLNADTCNMQLNIILCESTLRMDPDSKG